MDIKIKEKDFKFLIKVVLILLALVFVGFFSPFALQNDTFYDIVLGKRFFTQGMFRIDDYSIHANLVYQTHHYFICIFEYLVYSLDGFQLLHVLEVILTAIIALLFYFNNKYFVKNRFLAYVLMFLELAALNGFISLRAQMYSYIVFLIEILILNKFLDKPNKLYFGILLALPLVLSNVHSGTIFLYFIILATYMVNIIKINISKIKYDERINKNIFIKFCIIFIIGAILTIVNPYGYRAITYGIKTLNDTFINNNISEFLPFSIKSSNGMFVYCYVTFIFISLLLSKKKVKLQEIILFIGTTYMTLTSNRHFSVLVITSVVYLEHVESLLTQIKDIIFKFLEDRKYKQYFKYCIYSALFLIYVYYLYSLLFSGSRAFDQFVSESTYPVNAVQYIKKNLPKDARIFNEYGWGSYLMFNDIKVFIDSRCDLYTAEYNKGVNVANDYINTIKCNKYYGDTVKQYNIQYFLLKNDVPLAKMLLNDKNYELIYRDEISYIIKVLN